MSWATRAIRSLAPILLAAVLFGTARPASPRSDIGTELEKIVGRQLASSLRREQGTDEDPLLLPWIREMGARVSAPSPRRNVAYTFDILGTDVANAFSLPGGYIFVTRGMLDVVESDDELATILAHESGHVAERHAQKQIGENLAFLGLMTALNGAKYDKLRTGATILNVLVTLARSRQMEAQADVDGIDFAARAGYDPRGLVHFFEGFNGREPSALERYFETHPTPKSRIAAAERSPLVAKPTAEIRETAAAGYAARGLIGSAAVARIGGDALLLPPQPPLLVLSESWGNERRAVDADGERIRRGLRPAARAESAGSVLQQVLLVNNQPNDLRWLFLAARAYAVQADVDNYFARTLRVAQVAEGTFDALARTQATSGESRDTLLGRDEVQRALERDAASPARIRGASLAAAVVLADLNNRFYRPRGTAGWLRYGADEGLLLYAERELSQADRTSGEAWRILSIARIRRYQARLTELIPSGDAEKRRLWLDLAHRRFGMAAETTGATDNGPTGDRTARAALAIELGVGEASVEAGRNDETWASWILAKHGTPENVATVMRLLTLDLERETAAKDRERTVPIP